MKFVILVFSVLASMSSYANLGAGDIGSGEDKNAAISCRTDRAGKKSTIAKMAAKRNMNTGMIEAAFTEDHPDFAGVKGLLSSLTVEYSAITRSFQVGLYGVGGNPAIEQSLLMGANATRLNDFSSKFYDGFSINQSVGNQSLMLTCIIENVLSK